MLTALSWFNQFHSQSHSFTECEIARDPIFITTLSSVLSLHEINPKCLIPHIQTGDYIWSWLVHVQNKMKLLKWIINISWYNIYLRAQKRHFQSASNIDAIYELCNFRIFMPSVVALTGTPLHDPLFSENQYRAARTEEIALQMFVAECITEAVPVRKVHWWVEWITKKS